MRLASGLMSVVVDATAASELGVAGAISMRAATMAEAAAVVMDAIKLSSRVPFLRWGVEGGRSAITCARFA
jgi:hypothetical protein